ncbi:hypothetical protein FHL15_001707 [Xylaria flabelliformis]|uniref:Uncharacterized protein n=1 Tax=Xylaria flabelliformis TaxID=2512241 RepID=A0A553IB49_9PEZI|nr:hypothetical protein FHL15_001707 [Xylaria flabelliformis]
MAPSSKGTNPAPNYTVTMNRVQTQIEAQLRIVRSFMPSRPPATQQSTSSAKTTFSALASTSKPATSSSTFQSRQQTQKQDSESLFTETRAQDPNAGLGFGGSSKRNSEREKERENQILRSRLLGRKRGAGNASGRTSRREESSDEEPGRSGLGRAKKRARRDVLKEEEEKEGEEILSPGAELEAPESAGSAEKVGAAQSNDGALKEEDDGDVITKDGPKIALGDNPMSIDAKGASEQKKSKKRKKKRKKNKSKDAEGE